MGLFAYLFKFQPSELFAMEAEDFVFWKQRADIILDSLASGSKRK